MKSSIKVAHVHLENTLTICNDYVQVLIVENPSEFYNMILSLNGQFDGADGDFAFSRDGTIISAQKNGAIISDLFGFDVNDKKIITSLHKNLEEIAYGEKIALFNQIESNITAFLEELAFASPCAVDYTIPKASDLFKAASLKFANAYESLEEKIVCYINALIQLKKCEFFVFVNLKSVLSDEKLAKIYSHCLLEQVGLLLIESAKIRPLLPNEKAVIITEDLCEIVENYKNLC